MRGKVALVLVVVALVGITPAGAGKSESGVGIKEREEDHLRGCGEKLISGARHSTLMDHPRGCGEKTNVISPGVNTRGSPPRVRGKD